MAKARGQSLAVLVLAATVGGAWNATHADALRNPFVRPDIERAAAVNATGVQRVPQVAAPKFKLRATVVAGAASVANLDGNIIAIGESLDGYSLVNVDRESIVVEKSGRKFTLRVVR